MIAVGVCLVGTDQHHVQLLEHDNLHGHSKVVVVGLNLTITALRRVLVLMETTSLYDTRMTKHLKQSCVGLAAHFAGKTTASSGRANQ